MMTAEVRRLPEEGEIVLVTVKEVTGHGAYITLDEYDGTIGFLHISEIATGWIRNIERYIRPKQKTVLKVIRVNRSRAEVDLSLKQVTGDERKSKLIEVKKNEKAAAFMGIVKNKANLSDSQIASLEDEILKKFDLVYDMFETVSRKGIESIHGLGFSEEVVKAIAAESNKIQIPHVEIMGILEISVGKPDGIDRIKNILAAAEMSKSNTSVDITYVSAPKYRIVIKADNFKSAEKLMNSVLDKIKTSVNQEKGTFEFKRDQSRKVHSQP
jgi:translation initiation factor 2 subunit 1